MEITKNECLVSFAHLEVFRAIREAFLSMPIPRSQALKFEIYSDQHNSWSGSVSCVLYSQGGSVYERHIATYSAIDSSLLHSSKGNIEYVEVEKHAKWRVIQEMVSGWDMPEIYPSFHKQKYYHGICAYRLDERTLEERAGGVIGNEISASTRPIGPVGLILKGEVLCFSNIDLFSGVVDGHRLFDKKSERAEGLCYVPSEVTKMWDHDEAILIPETIEGIFYKEYINEEMLEEAKYLAKKYNVPLVSVEPDSSSLSFSSTDLSVTREMWERESEDLWYESDEYLDYHINH